MAIRLVQPYMSLCHDNGELDQKPCVREDPMTTAILVLVASLFLPAERVQPPPSVVAITHVTVIDTNGGPVHADRTVVIKDGRIVDVRKSAEESVPKGTDIVDGNGKFLIPGLWDMHSHIAAANRAGAQEYL